MVVEECAVWSYGV